MRRSLLFSMLLACGGSASLPPAEIPPLDEPLAPPEARAETVEAVVEREDLGVLSVLTEQSESPVITLRVSFDAGSAEDPPGKEGLTRLAAQLMAEGGAGALSTREVSQRLYPMAASLGASTGRDQTVFVGRVHRDHLADFYPLFRDTLVAPRLAESDFERLRAAAQSALTLELRGNNDEELGKESLQAMLYEDHPYGHPPLGTATGLEALMLDDVRTHIRRMFCAGRATVGVAGAFEDAFITQLRSDLARLARDSCVGRRVLPPAPEEAARVWLVDKPSAASVAISMGLPLEVTRDHPDYPALTLAAAYLGQHRTFAGRLMQKMRGDRGLNYGDYAYAEHFDQDGWGRFPAVNRSRRQQYFSIWIRPVRAAQAHFALRMAVRELRLFVEEGLSEEDFERIREFTRRYYALFQQTESRRLGFALDDRYYDTVDPWLTTLKQGWEALSAEQVNEAIRRHIDPAKLQIAIVTADAASFADTLASEAPSPIRYRATVPEEVRSEDEDIIGYRVGIPRQRMRLLPLGTLFE